MAKEAVCEAWFGLGADEEGEPGVFSLAVLRFCCWGGGEDGERVGLNAVFAGERWDGDEDVFVWFPALCHVLG